MFNNMALGTKLTAGFLAVAIVVLVVGLLGLKNVQVMSNKTTEIVEHNPLISSAKELKYSISRSQTILMEMLEAENKQQLDEVWSEQEEMVKKFDIYIDAILNGAQTANGEVYASDDERLRQSVSEVEKFHNEKFVPPTNKVYNLQLDMYVAQEEDDRTRRVLIGHYYELYNKAEQFKEQIVQQIKGKAQRGAGLAETRKREIIWMQVALEMKRTIVEIRLIIENAGQAETEDDVNELTREFNGHIKKMNEWVTALLNGGTTGEGRILKLSFSNFITTVSAMQKAKNGLEREGFNLLSSMKKLIKRKGQRLALDAAADGSANQMFRMLNNIEAKVRQEISGVVKESKATASAASIQSVLGIICGAVIAIILGVFITRSITGPINQVIENLATGAGQVNSGSNQISQSSQALSAGANTQAANLEEISSSLEEMEGMTRKNATNANQANQIALEASDSAERSSLSLKRMGEAIEKIKGSSAETAKIVKTIDEIAFQTNLLALNAAVEAARAGEAGKGFAVVAEEVRNLAKRSADAVKSTSELIDESQKNAQEGVAVSQEVETVLQEITGKVKQVTQFVTEVSSASNEQATGIESVNKSVSQMDKITQASASNAEQLAATSEEFSAQVKELNAIVSALSNITGTSLNGNS